MQKTIPKNTNNKKANKAQKDGQGMKVQKSQMDLHINESSVMDAGCLWTSLASAWRSRAILGVVDSVSRWQSRMCIANVEKCTS